MPDNAYVIFKQSRAFGHRLVSRLAPKMPFSLRDLPQKCLLKECSLVAQEVPKVHAEVEASLEQGCEAPGGVN